MQCKCSVTPKGDRPTDGAGLKPGVCRAISMAIGLKPIAGEQRTPSAGDVESSLPYQQPAVHPCQRHERHARSRVLRQSTQAYRSTGLIAFVVTDRLQPRSHRPRAHCSSTGSKSRTHQESALQLDLGRLVETCSARYRHRRSEGLDVTAGLSCIQKGHREECAERGGPSSTS